DPPPAGSTVQWYITNSPANSAGAGITSPTVGNSVTVAASQCGAFTLWVVITPPDGGAPMACSILGSFVNAKPPSFVNFPADATVECPGDTSPAATGTPTGDDGCSSASVTHSDSESSGGCVNHVVKVITRTCTVTDACGNSASQAQTIAVQASRDPSVETVPRDAER